MSLGLALNNSCTDPELRKAIEKASRLYAPNVKVLEGSEPEAYTDSEKLLPVDEV